ncbi:MAG: hypothetical protein ACJA0H_000091 [Francisellaceae bacterium]|jgi:hypothetical protein
MKIAIGVHIIKEKVYLLNQITFPIADIEIEDFLIC